MFQYLLDIDRSARKQILKGHPLPGCLRVQGKGGPPDADVKLILQFLNTPGDEIAPGSDIVGKDF